MEHNKREGWIELEKFLLSDSTAAWNILDDAIMGCLQTNTVLELLGDYDIPFTHENQRKLHKLLHAAIKPGS